MATTLSHFPLSSSPSNSRLPLSDANANMADTTMAPPDLAPAERSMPVGYRFHPTDQQLVGHYLHHKLKADDLSIHDTIPEFGLCKGEPWDLLEWATSASGAKFDESQCFFFSPRDYKYSNSTRSNRATLGGFWKPTGRDRKITSKGTNKVIGTKKTLVYYERRVPRAIKTNWITHEYHDDQLSLDQRSHVVCWLRKDDKKKTKEKTHQLVDDYGSQANISMNSDEHYMSSMMQGSSESSEVIDSMIQMPFGSNEAPNEAVESMIQVSSQLNRAIDSMIQIPFESNKVVDSFIQVSSQSNGAIDSMIQIPFESNEVVDSSHSDEAIDSMIQFESDEAVDSMIQVSSQTHEIINPTKQISPQSYEAIRYMIQTPFKSNKNLTSIIQTPLSESNSTIELDSIIQMPFKSNEESASIIHTPLSESNSNVAVDSMIQPHFKRGEELASIIHTLPHESNSTMTVDSMIQTSIKPTIQPDESSTSMIHIPLPPEPNSIGETSFDAGQLGEFGFSLFDRDSGEFGFSLFDCDSGELGFSLFDCDSGEFDFISPLQSPRIDEQGLFDGNI